MAKGKPKFREDLFEIDNAKHLNRDQLVATFVPTKAFWRLLSAKNHIILGARGSGKTALAKMLSHDHLSYFKNKQVQDIIMSKSFIGIYVPTSVEWVGGLKNKPWQTEAQAEYFFQWKLNLSTCMALLIVIRSCLDTYIKDRGERAKVEIKLANLLSESWVDSNDTFDTISSLQEYLEDLEHLKQKQLTRLRIVGQLPEGESVAGLVFEMDLFNPMKRGMTITSRVLDFPEDCTWVLCLDEAEFLEPMHHRILNSYLRSHSGNLVFKITTMPYYHHTLDTNIGVPLNVGHDFEYVYIDQDPVLLAVQKGEEGQTFATTIFNKRAEVSGEKYKGITLKDLLGKSEMLDPKKRAWGPNSNNLSKFKKYAHIKTLIRAEKLFNDTTKFRDQIGRKIYGALLLRDAVAKAKGRGEIDLYSGVTMAIRCGDANPRRLIRIFNNLLLEVKWDKSIGKNKPLLSRKTQTRVLISFSTSTLIRVQSEPDGPELYDFLETLGTQMANNLHSEPLTTDQISSIIVDKGTSDEHWQLVKKAVSPLGLLFPNISTNNPDQMPVKQGTFHLAYVLAPHFKILPRRGKAWNLSTVLSYQHRKITTQQNIFN